MPATLSPHGSTASSSAAQPDLPRLNVHYVPSRLPAGVVVGLWGDAVMRQDDGGTHALQLGDVVLKGDVLLTRQNGVVEISLGGDAVATNVRPVTYPTGDDALDRIIASLDNGELEMEPGAGLEGGGDGSLQPGMIVDRVIEIVTPQEYQYAYDRTPSFVEPESADGTLGTGLDQGGGTDTGSGNGGEGSHHAQVGLGGPPSVIEGQTTGYTVSLSQPATTDVTVKLTYSGTATDGGDYTAITTVTIPAGQSSITFDLKTLDDALAEGAESVTITIGEISGTTAGQTITIDPAHASVTTTITDDVGDSGGGTPGAEDTCLVSISGPASVVEGEPATGYTVSLSQPAATDVTVKLTYSGTATDGSDYTAVTTVTIPAGQSSVTFDLKTLDDALAEGAETITISVGDITGGGFEAIAADPAQGSVTTTITDDVGGGGGGTPGAEDTCLVSISGPASVIEGEPATGYTVSLSQPAATDVTVKLTYSGTATDGSDYTAITTVTVPAGQSSVTFDLKTIDDALAEGSETITISVGDITGGGFEAIAADPAQGSVTTTITDDVGGSGGGTPGGEDTCLVSISGPAAGSITEGESGSYTVSLSQPAATDVTVKLTYSGTATDGSDYTAVTTVTIPAGQSSVTFDLKTIDDALAEGSETITISVGDITGGGFEAIAADPAQGSVTTTITDDVGGSGGGTPGSEDTCLVSIAGPAAGSITEGESGSYTVSLSQPATTDVTVKLTYSGTATDGSDYTAVTTVTIPAGQSSITFDLKTIDDALAEGSETITVSVGDITGGGFETVAADPAQGSVTTTITDDIGGSGGGTPGSEDTCLVSISGPASVVEGEPATGYTVSLSQPATTDVTVKLTYSGTATDGSDYTAVTTVTIPAGQSSITFDLKTIDDALAEGAETITISVGDITGGGFEAIAADPAQGSVTTTITDDVGGSGGGTPGSEDTCLVSIAGPASVVEGEPATGYTVSLSQPAATDVTVKLTYSGTAADGSDYTAVTTVTIPAGQSSITFDLKTIDDALAEGSETITVSVGDITGGGFEAIATDPAHGSVSTTITDDIGGSGGGTPGAEDTCLVSISGPTSVVEGEPATGYTVSLSQPATTNVTVKLTYSGTATDGSDYTAVTTVTVPAGQSSVTFDLKTLDDAQAEGSETITISVGDITGGGFEAVAADPAQGSVTTTITDDVGGGGGGTPGAEDTCLVSIAGPAAGSITEGESGSYTVSLSQPAATDVTVKLTYSGTATDGSDYTAVTTVTVPAGQSSVTFDLKTIDDALAEGSETITISVGDITGGGFEAIAADPTHGSVTTTITDDVGGGGGTPGAEDTCLVSIAGPAAGSITEGESGSYTVSLSQPAATDVTVKLTYSGTATDGSDYTAVTTVTIPAGQSSVTFDLKTLDDALAEGSETITVSVGDITGGGFEAVAADPAQGSVTTTITDDVGGSGGGTPGAEDTCLVSIAGPTSVVEGEPATSYTVSLSQPAATDVTVKLTYSGTATDGSDYTAITTVTVPAGQSSATFDLKTLDDALAEGAETITVSVGDITGGGFEAIAADPAQGSVTTTITDDVGGGGGGTPGAEDTCLVSISGPASVVEGEPATGYTVSLSQPAATDVTVKLTYSGTATDGSDYTAVTTVTIPAGQSSVTFDLKTIDDALAEGAETITISVGDITGGGFEAIAADPAQGSVTTTITDDVGGSGGGTPGGEDTCLVSIAGPAAGSITEGESGSYTVSLSQPAATDVTVKLTYSGTAADGSDYTAVTTVTVPAGQSSVTFDLKTIDDALAEGAETITISVGDITGGGFEAIAADPAHGSVTTTITDDVGGGSGGTPGSEDTCLVSITGPGEVVEGQVAEGYVVSLSQPSAQGVVVGLSYSGTAVDGSDFVRVASITIAAGQTQATFSISTLDDALAEGAEQFTVAIARIGAPGSEATAVDPAHGAVTTTLIDDVGGSGGGTPGAEDTCLVSISGPGEVVEGEVAGGYTVSLTQPAQTDVTVRLVCSGTASAGTDFIQVASVTIPAGQSQASFDLKTLDDALAEGTETITLTLGTISGGGFEAIAGDPARASVTTLLHDDAGPSGPGTPGAEDTCLVSISGPTTVVEGETAGGYTVSLSQPAATDVTVKLAYTGTATDGSDYSAVTTVTIPAGQSSVAFDLKTLDDALAEGKETLTVSVGEISGGGFEAIVVHPLERSVTTTLLDDAGPFGPGTPGAEDTCLVSITGPAAVAEGAVASGYTVTLSQAAITDVVIRLNYGGSASAGSDFAPVASVTIPAGSRSASFDLPTAADGVAEGGEQITVTLGTISGGGFEVLRGDPGAFSVTTQIADGNSAPVLQADRAVTPEDTAVSGNLLANDRDADGDTLTVTHFTWNDQSFTAGSSATIAGVGTLTVGSDGQFLFTPAKDYAGAVPAASCTVSDGHGHAAVSTLTLAITPVDDAPVLRGGTALLSEEGLPGGRPETGDPVTTCATGRLQFSDVDSSTLSFTLGAPSGLYSSGGVALSWSGDGSAAHPLVGSAGGQPVLSATIDAEGRYTVTLHAPLDHPVRGSEDLLTLSLGVQVSDGHSSSSATIDVGVRDDSPVPLCVARCADLSLVQTNLLVTLDVSGSMSTRDGIDGQTRLQSAIASIEKLIDSYAEHGDVMVRLVTFSTGASERGACWMTADQARSALHCLSAGGNTNYDAALDAARGAFDDPGRLVDGQSVAYFFSDGRPNLPTSDVGIDAAEQKTWESFLDSHDIRSYAIGLGCDVPVSALAPVAHDGVDHNDSISPLLVTRFEQLDAALAQTVADPVQGDLVAGGLDHAAGADGGHLSALIVDGVQHRWDPATSASDTVTVRTASGGEFTFNMENGHYSYQPPAGASHDYQEKIGFVLTDADGDSRTGSLTLGIDVDGNGHCDVQCAPATSCLVPDTSGCLTGSILNWSLADPCSHDGLTTTDATHTTSTGSCSSGGTTDTLHCGDLLTQAADLLAQWSSGGGTGGSCTSAPAPTCAPAPAPADCSGVLSSAEQLLAQTLIRQASDTSSHCGP
ncbi:immunoglobulin-like domain-containing protein [Sphaerotilus uruguayifluvii]|uniref:Catabolite regulation protein CreA n=1 Tax=Sphaerotilus uruguayifluvii TaxID=2735897 RepID=A0ABX2G0T9_9BURK|nr:immunoglobulin-like domain-containing protein [Leptothrix sp. C29]NRT55664.1 catabolite regulation protein CreA [Leptothrix sp. C29]